MTLRPVTLATLALATLAADRRTLPAKFSWPPGVTPTTRFTPPTAIAVALWNNNALEADLAALGIAKADLLDAGLLRNPNLWSLMPVGKKPFEILLNWPIEEWWQRKKRVRAAQVNLDAVAKGLEQNGLNLIRDVSLAHADLALAQRRAVTLAEAATLRERIAGLTVKRQEAGDASGLDVSLAQADARSARELAQRAQTEIVALQPRLRNLLGLTGNEAIEAVEEDFTVPDGAEDALVDSAFTARPDLRAAEIAVQAAAERAKWQRSRFLQMLTPILSVKPVGTPFATRAAPGVQVEIPIFNRNQGQIARADAEVVQAAWRYAALRDRVELETREAYRRYMQARQSKEQLAGQVRPVVEQSIRQAEQAFRNGDASFLNVLEPTRTRYDIELRQLDAEAAERRALAELGRAAGRKP